MENQNVQRRPNRISVNYVKYLSEKSRRVEKNIKYWQRMRREEVEIIPPHLFYLFEQRNINPREINEGHIRYIDMNIRIDTKSLKEINNEINQLIA